MSNLIELSAVASGGAVGAVIRFLIGRSEALTSLKYPLPWATLLVNVLGCFLIGIVTGLLQKGDYSSLIRSFLIPGVLGGFTTYSAFAFESYSLVRQDNVIAGGLYIGLTVVLGLVAVAAGLHLTTWTPTSS